MHNPKGDMLSEGDTILNGGGDDIIVHPRIHCWSDCWLHSFMCTMCTVTKKCMQA